MGQLLMEADDHLTVSPDPVASVKGCGLRVATLSAHRREYVASLPVVNKFTLVWPWYECSIVRHEISRTGFTRLLGPYA